MIWKANCLKSLDRKDRQTFQERRGALSLGRKFLAKWGSVTGWGGGASEKKTAGFLARARETKKTEAGETLAAEESRQILSSYFSV